MIYKRFKIERFKMMVKTDLKENLINEPQYNAIMYELDSNNTLEYKYGIYTMYLIMYMGTK